MVNPVEPRGGPTGPPVLPPALRVMAIILSLAAVMETFFAVIGADLGTGLIALCWTVAAALTWAATSGSLGLGRPASLRAALARTIVVLLVLLALVCAPLYVGALGR